MTCYKKSVNGFKIIKSTGAVIIGGRNIRTVIAQCKQCSRHFDSNVKSLARRRGCGCMEGGVKAKPLDDYINSYKVICDLGVIGGARRAVVLCKVCGEKHDAPVHVLSGSISCGCLHPCGTKISKYIGKQDRLINVYKGMLRRCNNKSASDYHRYGGRGIMVCNEWADDKDSFIEWALSAGYKEDLQIDRIDNNKSYYPGNCKWSTAKEQANNRRTTLKLSLEDKVKIKAMYIPKEVSMDSIGDKFNVSRSTVANVLKENLALN